MMAEKGGPSSSWYNPIRDGSWGKKAPGDCPSLVRMLTTKLCPLEDFDWMTTEDRTEDIVLNVMEFNVMIGSEASLARDTR